MKLIGDEHISPKIVKAVCEIALNRAWTFEAITKTSPYVATEDEDWVVRFAKTGGNCVLSSDRNMLKRDTFIQKITQTDLILIYMPADYAEGRRQYQAAKILYWWPKIEICIARSDPGRVWLVPKGMGGGDLREYTPKTQHTKIKRRP